MQTVQRLHVDCKLAHLDISCNNIMLRNGVPDKWDQVCLLDFGFAQKCVTGVSLPLAYVN